MILLTGASGQLGQCVAEELQKRLLAFFPASHKTLDIADARAVQDFFAHRREAFDCIINCAACTQVDRAEKNAARAYAVNAYAPWLLAQTGIPLIHVSTDYVFDGRSSVPYEISSPCSPLSVYGLSKRSGETALLEAKGQGAIVRTAWVYSAQAGSRNFFQTILKLASEKNMLEVVDDQIGAPTYAPDLASTLIDLYEQGAHRRPMHVLHFTNAGACSRHEFAQAIVSAEALSCTVRPISSIQYLTKAKRPAYSVLSLSEIEGRYSIHPRHWRAALHEALQHIDHDSL